MKGGAGLRCWRRRARWERGRWEKKCKRGGVKRCWLKREERGGIVSEDKEKEEEEVGCSSRRTRGGGGFGVLETAEDKEVKRKWQTGLGKSLHSSRLRKINGADAGRLLSFISFLLPSNPRVEPARHHFITGVSRHSGVDGPRAHRGNIDSQLFVMDEQEKV